jgi:hypothetical protein
MPPSPISIPSVEPQDKREPICQNTAIAIDLNRIINAMAAIHGYSVDVKPVQKFSQEGFIL